jgi:Leucine-rich repeat (LRR) protein
VLDASNNTLREVPAVLLAALPNLQRLVLANNALLALPGEGLMAMAASLKFLNLESNELTSLPAEVGTYCQRGEAAQIWNSNKSTARFKGVSLAGSSTTPGVEQVGVMMRLEKLVVSGNRLVSLPEELASCTKLTQVVASRNHLTSLPSVLPPRLEELDVSFNRLQV